MYNTDKMPTNEDIAERLVIIKDINDRWQDITDNFYGAKVGKALKDIAPADPYILYDLSAISLINEGMSEQDAIKTVDNYTHKEWLRELEGFKPTITTLIDRADRLLAEHPNKRTVERLKSDKTNYRN